MLIVARGLHHILNVGGVSKSDDKSLRGAK